jgi:hypothetical protein
MLIIPVLIIAGCSTQPPSRDKHGAEQPVTQAGGRELSEIENLLLKAQSSAPLVRAEYTLLAAERLFQQQDYSRTQSLLDSIIFYSLPDHLELQYHLLKARTALAQGDPGQALESLARVEADGPLSHDLRQTLDELYPQALLSGGGDITSLRRLLVHTSSGLSLALVNSIWQQLMALTPEALRAESANANDYVTQGWFELALLVNNQNRDIKHQTDRLYEWLLLWNNHPAAGQLPDELALLLDLSTQPAAHLALLLPLQGKLEKPAQAIIDGFMAAYFDARTKGSPVPKITLFDSTQYPSLALFYLRAQQQGVDLVIGPLDKTLLGQLQQQLYLDIPTLALNYSEDEDQVAAVNLYQFGLSAEDEALQAARQAWQDGHRIALSLTPDNDWGGKINAAFKREWKRLGGIMAAQQQFSGNNDFSEKISTLLSVDLSEQRATRARKLLGQPIKHETRRRNDVDFLFLSALANDARQIKPTLAFHYAARLPVYATSHIFSGRQDPLKDQDLNGVFFSETPWLLEPAPPLKSVFSGYRDNINSRFGKLYALGIDAFRLTPYLAQLQSIPKSYLKGVTGRLSVNTHGEVSRLLNWVQIKKGAPFVLKNQM